MGAGPAGDKAPDSSGALGGFFSSVGISALYTTFVFALGKFFRSLFVGTTGRIPIEEMQNPQPYWATLFLAFDSVDKDSYVMSKISSLVINFYTSSVRKFHPPQYISFSISLFYFWWSMYMCVYILNLCVESLLPRIRCHCRPYALVQLTRVCNTARKSTAAQGNGAGLKQRQR